jgi:peptide/nickel transport system permease protein
MAVPLIVIITVATFFLVRMAPGDPAVLLAGDAPTPEFLAAIQAEYGLNDPVLVQLKIYLTKVLQGDFGKSIYQNRPVWDIIWGHFPATLLITCVSMVLATALGVTAGAIAGASSGTRLDAAVSGFALVGFSLPTFWVGQLLILVFAVHLNWLPAGGLGSLRYSYSGVDHYLDVARHLVLPCLTLALFEMAMIARFTRAAVVESLGQDYVLVARAKGADRFQVVTRYALLNSTVTIITVVGLEFGVLLAGAVVTEIIYGIPGVGRVFFDAISKRDFPLLTGCFIFASGVVIVVNILTDVLSSMVDPRFGRRN